MIETLNGDEETTQATDQETIQTPVVEQTWPVTLRYLKLDRDLPDLRRGTAHSAGIDLYSVRPTFELRPGQSANIDNGVIVEIPPGFFGLVSVRSGLGMKGITSHVGIIDSDYRGEVRTKLFNLGGDPIMISKYERIANLTIIPYLYAMPFVAEELSETTRGANGFGSTGRH